MSAEMVYAIESNKHLSVWLLRANLNKRARRKARADEIIPLLDDENMSSTIDANTMKRSNRLKLSDLNFLSVRPRSLRILSLANSIVNNKLESVRKLGSGSGYLSMAS